MNIFWNKLAEYLPRSIAPNLLTFIALICSIICCGVLLFFSPNLVDEIPSWAFLVSCFFLFIYQTLDALDGKQARNTKTSSALGQLFDHGCDSLTATLVSVTAAAAMGCGHSVWTIFACIGVQMPVLVLNWYEVHTGIFLTATSELGVSEGQFLVMFLLISCSIAGSSFWHIPLTTLPDSIAAATNTPVLQIRHLIFASFVFSSLKLMYDTIPHALRTTKNKSLALKQMLSFIIYVVTAFLLFTTGVYSRFGCIAYFLCAVNFSSMASRLVICATIEKYFAPIQKFMLPYYAMVYANVFLAHIASPALNASVSVVLPHSMKRLFPGGSIGVDGVLMLSDLLYIAQCLWCLIYFQDFIRTTIDDICKAVGIFIFEHLKKREPQKFVEGTKEYELEMKKLK
eukprot:GDKJ01012081.1.p1 GENE.GDKJ01012081.1~~GDKJ01012081.1.p1  ORF type:complete len:437 (+),score=107.27 GDKJ01012081.1:115-1311(+)